MTPEAPDPILRALLSDEEDEATYKLFAATHDEDEGQVIERQRKCGLQIQDQS